MCAVFSLKRLSTLLERFVSDDLRPYTGQTFLAQLVEPTRGTRMLPCAETLMLECNWREFRRLALGSPLTNFCFGALASGAQVFLATIWKVKPIWG